MMKSVVCGPELSIGQTDPWVGSRLEFQLFGGLGWVVDRKIFKKLTDAKLT